MFIHPSTDFRWPEQYLATADNPTMGKPLFHPALDGGYVNTQMPSSFFRGPVLGFTGLILRQLLDQMIKSVVSWFFNSHKSTYIAFAEYAIVSKWTRAISVPHFDIDDFLGEVGLTGGTLQCGACA